MDFALLADEFDKLLTDARIQYLKEDYSALPRSVQYRMLWLAYKSTNCNGIHYDMDDFDAQYVTTVAKNFKRVVEQYADGNIDIEIDLQFLEREVNLTQLREGIWCLSYEAIQPDIQQKMLNRDYDSIISAVQLGNFPNRIGGICLNSLNSFIGYSTFNLKRPYKDSWPLKDLRIPSLYGTALAVHEWLHQFEYLGPLIGIEFPPIHSFIGEPDYKGYQRFNSYENSYDYFEFYRLLIAGKLPLTRDGKTRNVGMFPRMWNLIQRNALNVGYFTIQDADSGEYLIVDKEMQTITKGPKPCVWFIRYGGYRGFILIPEKANDKRMDLNNASDKEGQTVKLWRPTKFYNAQRWRIISTDNASCKIRTACESGRVLTVDTAGKPATIQNGEGIIKGQRWTFIRNK